MVLIFALSQPVWATTTLDASYFIDSDLLEAPAGLRGDVVLERLPEERQAFCARNEYDIAHGLNTSANGKIAFSNPDGPWVVLNKVLHRKIFNGGVCWWHTRFQRSAAYLVNFFPGRPRPLPGKARTLISQIIAMKSVIEIPGFNNLSEFTQAYEKEISSALSNWLLRDWATGHGSGERPFDTSSLAPAELRGAMDGLYERMLAQPQLIFLRIHSASVGVFDSHALLLTGIELLGNPLMPPGPQGYRLSVIDSNTPGLVSTVDYNFGDHNLNYCSGKCDAMIPRIDFDDDLAKIDGAVQKYCSANR